MRPRCDVHEVLFVLGIERVRAGEERLGGPAWDAFALGNNGFPVQNFYIQETVKDAAGVVTVKTIATALKAAVDPYAAKCAMK